MYELKGNGVWHVFELAWISVRRAAQHCVLIERATANPVLALLQMEQDAIFVIGCIFHRRMYREVVYGPALLTR